MKRIRMYHYKDSEGYEFYCEDGDMKPWDVIGLESLDEGESCTITVVYMTQEERNKLPITEEI